MRAAECGQLKLADVVAWALAAGSRRKIWVGRFNLRLHSRSLIVRSEKTAHYARVLSPGKSVKQGIEFSLIFGGQGIAFTQHGNHVGKDATHFAISGIKLLLEHLK